MRRKPTHLLWVLGLTLVSLSCNQNLEDYFNPDGLSNHVYRGPIIKMGDGSVRSFFTVSPAGVPLKIGIEMTDAALDNLPEDPMNFAANTFLLSIPTKAKEMTAFNHISLEWNPHGHPPGVYGEEHFDIHFYKMSLADQRAIPPYSPETAALFDNLPPAGSIPSSFVATPGGVPQMGKHWVDTKAPEYNGGEFSKTFIYGSYNGEVNFYEPMVTHHTLKSGVQSSTAFDQPTHFAPEDTYYPTKYEITMDARKKTHTVALTDFVWRSSVN